VGTACTKETQSDYSKSEDFFQEDIKIPSSVQEALDIDEQMGPIYVVQGS
jgi:hypothetical protein